MLMAFHRNDEKTYRRTHTFGGEELLMAFIEVTPEVKAGLFKDFLNEDQLHG